MDKQQQQLLPTEHPEQLDTLQQPVLLEDTHHLAQPDMEHQELLEQPAQDTDNQPLPTLLDQEDLQEFNKSAPHQAELTELPDMEAAQLPALQDMELQELPELPEQLTAQAEQLMEPAERLMEPAELPACPAASEDRP